MTVDAKQELINHPQPGVPFFSPIQKPQSGSAITPNPPLLFTPLKIRDLELPNRILVSPMCQYSADPSTSTPNQWHTMTLGGIWSRSAPGLTIIEATAILPNGRITPHDLGLWSDAQIPAYKTLVDNAHSLGANVAIQLAHAGRKAGTTAPWINAMALSPEWDFERDVVKGPVEGDKWDEHHAHPTALTIEEIHEYTAAWAAAARRAVAAGFDAIEIHGAHGYLLTSFLSPVTNTRTDAYGGPAFANRIRFLCDVVAAVRAAIPAGMPLFVRISGTEFLETSLPDTPSWTVDESARLAPILADLGVDLVDVSAGGNHPKQSFPGGASVLGHQVPFAAKVVEAVKGTKTRVGAVGGIKTGAQAQEILAQGKADVVLVGRQFQKEPSLVWAWADELGVDVKACSQQEWGVKGGRRKKQQQQQQQQQQGDKDKGRL